MTATETTNATTVALREFDVTGMTCRSCAARVQKVRGPAHW